MSRNCTSPLVEAVIDRTGSGDGLSPQLDVDPAVLAERVADAASEERVPGRGTTRSAYDPLLPLSSALDLLSLPPVADGVERRYRQLWAELLASAWVSIKTASSRDDQPRRAVPFSPLRGSDDARRPLADRYPRVGRAVLQPEARYALVPVMEAGDQPLTRRQLRSLPPGCLVLTTAPETTGHRIGEARLLDDQEGGSEKADSLQEPPASREVGI